MDIRLPGAQRLVRDRLSIDSELYLASRSTAIAAARDHLLSSGGDGDRAGRGGAERIAKLWLIRSPDRIRSRSPARLRGIRTRAELRSRVPKLVTSLVALTKRLYEVATSLDAVTCEINPCAHAGRRLVAADGKLEIDENADSRTRMSPRNLP